MKEPRQESRHDRRFDLKRTSLLLCALGLVTLATGTLAASRSYHQDGGFAHPEAIAGYGTPGEWSAVEEKVAELRGAGVASLTAGTDTVSSFRLTWKVRAGNPKQITMLAWSLSSHQAEPDTFVTYVRQR